MIYKYRKGRRVEKTIRQRIPRPSEIPVKRYADSVGDSRPSLRDPEDEYDYLVGQACIRDLKAERTHFIPAEEVEDQVRKLTE